MSQQDKDALNKEMKERERLSYQDMSQQDKDALNQERRDKYETVASRNNAEDEINHAHFLLQQLDEKEEVITKYKQSRDRK
eukprot:10903975-Ditylum_brightwellii.AAC.1